MIWKSKWGFQKWEKRPKGLRNTSSFLWKLCVWVPNCHPAVMFQKETFLRRILGTKEEGANPTNHSLRVSRSHVSQIRWYLNMRKISQFQFKSMPHIWHNFLKGSHDKTIKKKCVSTTDIKKQLDFVALPEPTLVMALVMVYLTLNLGPPWYRNLQEIETYLFW